MTPLTDEPVTSAKKEEENAFSFCLSSFSWPGVKDTYRTPSQKNVFRAFYFSFSDLCCTKEEGGSRQLLDLLFHPTTTQQDTGRQKGERSIDSWLLLPSSSSFFPFFLSKLFPEKLLLLLEQPATEEGRGRKVATC